MNKPTKILVVDDEPSLQSIILQLFKLPIKNQELQFTFAANGKEALEKINQDEDLGIVLTDINMPVMDGLSFLEKLQEYKATYRAVVISAYGDWSSIRLAMNKGACDFIPKPIDLKDLENTVHKVIEQYNHLIAMNRMQNQVIEFKKELQIASEIQQSIIPHSFEGISEKVKIFGTMIPAKEIGGDLYDIFKLDQDRLGFEIADVSGKGVPASLFMTMTSALIEGFALRFNEPKECLELVNHVLSTKNESSMFVTAFCGVLQLSTGKLTYCNAGHNPPFLVKKDGTLEEIARSEGLPLGVTGDLEKIQSTFIQKTIQLHNGQTLLLYTDGAIDAVNPQDERLGEERFKKMVQKYAKLSIEVLIESLIKDIREYIGTASQADDITLLGIEYV